MYTKFRLKILNRLCCGQYASFLLSIVSSIISMQHNLYWYTQYCLTFSAVWKSIDLSLNLYTLPSPTARECLSHLAVTVMLKPDFTSWPEGMSSCFPRGLRWGKSFKLPGTGPHPRMKLQIISIKQCPCSVAEGLARGRWSWGRQSRRWHVW